MTSMEIILWKPQKICAHNDCFFFLLLLSFLYAPITVAVAPKLMFTPYALLLNLLFFLFFFFCGIKWASIETFYKRKSSRKPSKSNERIKTKKNYAHDAHLPIISMHRNMLNVIALTLFADIYMYTVYIISCCSKLIFISHWNDVNWLLMYVHLDDKVNIEHFELQCPNFNEMDSNALRMDTPTQLEQQMKIIRKNLSNLKRKTVMNYLFSRNQIVSVLVFNTLTNEH